MNRYARSCAVGLAFLLWVATPGVGLPNVALVARAVDEHYNRMQTLAADFTEIYQGLGMERTESGKLWLKKPGKMRWEYRSPEEKLFVGDGRDAWLYLPAERQARKSSMKRFADLRSPLAFLLGKLKLEKELTDLSFAPQMAVSNPEDVILRGVPRGLEDRVRRVALEVTPQHVITRIVVEGADDSITEYRFTNQRENVAVSDTEFHFVPAPGTEVVENEAGN